MEKRALEHRKIDRTKTIEKTRQNSYLNTVIEAKLAEIESRFKSSEEQEVENNIMFEREMMENYYQAQIYEETEMENQI